jgi:NADH:ubiquinone oxidoreductase subunit C
MNREVDRKEFFKDVLGRLQNLFPEEDLQAKQVPYEEVFVTLSPQYLRVAVAELVKRYGIRHLSTITADTVAGELMLHYHFWHRYGLTLSIPLGSLEGEIDSIVDLIPGAAFYEREVFGMYGVTFAGHPNLRPLVLPEDWDDEPPMLIEPKRG